MFSSQFGTPAGGPPAGAFWLPSLLFVFANPKSVSLMASQADVALLQAQVAALQSAVETLQAAQNLAGQAADTWWMLSNGILVFFMQCGFGMLEAGSVSARATQNILLKNLMDTAIGCLLWWAVGYAVAFEGTNPFIGTASADNTLFFTIAYIREDDMAFDFNGTGTVAPGSYGKHWAFWWWQFTFASVSATIVSGAVAERAQLTAYIVYSSVMTLLIYPVCAHWVWSEYGWLSTLNPNAFNGGALDFAGSGAVHMTGGIASLVGAAVIGPRPGRFTPPYNKFRLPTCGGPPLPPPIEMPGHSTVLQALGTFILWMGWYGFNAGSTVMITGAGAATAAPVFIRTTLSGSIGGLSAVTMERYLGTGKIWSVGAMCNGILAGLVSVTAGCATIPIWAAVIHGFIGSLVYRYSAKFVTEVLCVDDPLDAFAVHGACGTWGVLAAGLFSEPQYSSVVHGVAGGGGLYGGGRALGANIIYILSITVWTFTTSFSVFWTLRSFGVLRADHTNYAGPQTATFTDAPNQIGFDGSKHGLQPYEGGGVPPKPDPAKPVPTSEA